MKTPTAFDEYVPTDSLQTLKEVEWPSVESGCNYDLFRVRHPDLGREVQISKVSGFGDIPVGELAAWLLSPDAKTKYDDTIAYCGSVPVDMQPNMKVVYQCHSGKFGVSGRRFIYVEYSNIDQFGVHTTLAFPVPDHLRAEASEKVRNTIGPEIYDTFTEGDIVLSGFELRNIGGDVELTYYQCVQANMRWVPQRILDRILFEQLKNTTNIPKVFRDDTGVVN